jgi:M6 family metalloprotease-like protein
MRKPHVLLIALLLMFCANLLSSDKLNVHKIKPLRQPKFHSYTGLLSRPSDSFAIDKKSPDYNRLLVILVDFQEEIQDDPTTTGNGKFLLAADSTYRTTVGSPPHNRAYYWNNLEALRFYYLAASQNGFNLQFDVYPQIATSYTLPQTMSYYNPAGASSELFLQRTEEYFRTAFELADSLDPGIDFSHYSHFMIIHAGSDWQHDVFSDTPCDLPSFFIHVRTGREAVVDGGSVLISHASNVPSTIAQDFDTYEAGSTTYYTGYGALNGVMAHEFGHSLGAVDLYDVNTSYPMVGQFDIMDSGASGITEDYNNPGVLIEGELPCLPGAYTRQLMFGDYLQQKGLLVQTSDVISTSVSNGYFQISTSSQYQPDNAIIPNLVKIPLNLDEYILVENRSVDPDNDGGTALKATPDHRVILYPTAYDDPADNPTFEYDYLLPSFVDVNLHAEGGGLLVWHVSDKVMYQEGQTGADGVFASNFANNTVNTDYNKRGVRIIEADGLPDIGNVYSYFWTGTPYEYFHNVKPVLNDAGEFMMWSLDPWRPELNSETNPPLLDDENHPSFYGLSDIGFPNAVMTFKLSAGAFDSIQLLGTSESEQIPLPVINSPLTENILPVLRDGAIHFYFYDAGNDVSWSELIDPLDSGIDSLRYEPVLSDLNNNGYQELGFCHQGTYYFVEFSGDAPEISTYSPAPIFPPLFAFGELYGTFGAIWSEKVNPTRPFYFVNCPYARKLAASDSMLVQLFDMTLVLRNPDLTEVNVINLPELFGLYEPVIVKNSATGEYTYFLVSDAGNIYKCFNNTLSCIYHNAKSSISISNLAVTSMYEYSPCLVFGRGNEMFIINQFGTLLPGYPMLLEDYQIRPFSHIKVRDPLIAEFSNTPIHYLIYLELSSGGYLAIEPYQREINGINSLLAAKSGVRDQTCYLPSEEKLFWFFTGNNNDLVAAELEGQTEQPFIWNGFRNGGTGQITLEFYEPAATAYKLKAFVFPSPATGSWATLRVENPSGNVNLRIYDIVGKLLYKETRFTEHAKYLDIQFEISDYSSGVYLAVVETNDKITRTKFAVQK